MKNIKQIMTIIMMLLVSITSVANSLRVEKDFGVRINLISLLKIEKIKDVDFGDVYIGDIKQNMKASGEFKVIGSKNTLVKFKVDQTQELTNGDNIIPMKTYVSNDKNGGETQTGDLSKGEYSGYLVAELGNIQGAQVGEYVGKVTLTVEYN